MYIRMYIHLYEGVVAIVVEGLPYSYRWVGAILFLYFLTYGNLQRYRILLNKRGFLRNVLVSTAEGVLRCVLVLTELARCRRHN